MEASFGEVADGGSIIERSGGGRVVGVCVGPVVEVLNKCGEYLGLLVWKRDFLFGCFAKFSLEGGAEESDATEGGLGGVKLDVIGSDEKRDDGGHEVSRTMYSEKPQVGGLGRKRFPHLAKLESAILLPFDSVDTCFSYLRSLGTNSTTG